MIKVGFVYLDDIYLIPHFIGSLAELYNDPEVDVDLLVNDVDHTYLYQILDLYQIPRSVVKILPTYLYKKIAYKIQGRQKPSTRYVIKKNHKKLLSYDVLAFTVFNHLHIKKEQLDKPKFVYLNHGAGDSGHPFTEQYKPIIDKFDLVISSGQKINDLFNHNAPYNQVKFEICGYQKFDFVKKVQTHKKLFPNDNPTVLYNPHFRENTSSFFKFGKAILEFFYQNKNYNLVFAPHSNLFAPTNDNPVKRDIIDKKYHDANNILIDLGSEKSIDMTYTYNADIYLGDLSSQVYEFLLNGPKPVIYLNAHNVDWQNNPYFQSWQLGKVINSSDMLKTVLETHKTWQKDFEQKQQKAMAYTFDIDPDKTASQRVAEAIKKLAKTN